MNEALDNIFLHEKPTLALMALEEINPVYAALIAKRIDSTFPHTSAIISQLEKHGLVKSNTSGRIRYLELTDRGRRAAKALRHLIDILQEQEEQWMRLEKLSQIINSNRGQSSALILGPIRRDLTKLKERGNDDLCRAAEELDNLILENLNSSK
jgi:DNA-binding MarR family transcriptional regulator